LVEAVTSLQFFVAECIKQWCGVFVIYFIHCPSSVCIYRMVMLVGMLAYLRSLWPHFYS